MEIDTTTIEYNFQKYDLDVYNVDINDLEKGTLFGVIADVFSFGTIFPEAYVREDIVMEWNVTSNNELVKSFIPTPLLFKKLDGNLAEELLTGEIFVIIKSEDDFIENDEEQELKIKEFQESVKKYSKNNAFIALDDSPIFVVNDGFKSIFNDTLFRKDEVKKVLKEIKHMSQIYFDDMYNYSIDKIQTVANTDNFLYDIEHKNKTSH